MANEYIETAKWLREKNLVIEEIILAKTTILKLVTGNQVTMPTTKELKHYLIFY
ncbi:MAG: hypothetical protein JXB49_30740 [Bacteroidales bacterium]|nr:hypothetical protein [Bacteroidales bacterium]